MSEKSQINALFLVGMLGVLFGFIMFALVSDKIQTSIKKHPPLTVEYRLKVYEDGKVDLKKVLLGSSKSGDMEHIERD